MELRKIGISIIYLMIMIIFILSMNYYDFFFTERIYINDLSTQKALITNRSYKVHLVTYADGEEVYFQNQNALALSALNKGFDVIHLHNFASLDQNFTAKNFKILSQRRGAGYWLWKPYIIRKALSEAKENDIIIYIDSGVMVKAGLEKGFEPLLKIVESSSQDIFLFLNCYTNRYFKRDLMIYFNMDKDEYRNMRQQIAAFAIFKNTKRSREFVEEWLILCENEQLLTDIPSVNKEYFDFTDHRHDQAILTLLSYKYADILVTFPIGDYEEWFVHHRRREKNKMKSLFN